MLYNHSINDISQDYQVNDFVGDLNKVYLAINRATDYLSIITTFNEGASDIIRLLVESKKIKEAHSASFIYIKNVKYANTIIPSTIL